MSNQDFNPNSVDATLARIEAKLDAYTVTQHTHSNNIALVGFRIG